MGVPLCNIHFLLRPEWVTVETAVPGGLRGRTRLPVNLAVSLTVLWGTDGRDLGGNLCPRPVPRAASIREQALGFDPAANSGQGTITERREIRLVNSEQSEGNYGLIVPSGF